MSATRLAKEVIKIPKRINRGPTDILKALAATVKYIPTEPDTMLQDDPFLLPIRPIDRSLYSLSKNSGRNTARFLLNKHPELFKRDDAEPKVAAFIPDEEFRADMSFDENDLKWCLEHNDTINAIVAYEALEKEGVELSQETLLDFFEMICYTNEERLCETLEFERRNFFRKDNRTLWKKSGIASKIFDRIKEDVDPPRVYSAMIAGLCKHRQYDKAKQVFDDYNESHPTERLYVNAYEALIMSIPHLNSSYQTGHQAVQDIAKHMESNLIAPNLKVFNAILLTYRQYHIDEEVVRKSFKLLNDMIALNIKPSLHTYELIITMMVNFKGGAKYRDLIHSLLDIIQYSDENIEIKHEEDIFFLRRCMRMFAEKLGSMTLANKLHRIYLKQPKYFSHMMARSDYLNTYFKLMIVVENLDNIMEFYNANVPYNFKPSPDVYDALAESLDLYKADNDIIKKVGNDILMFRLYDKVTNDELFKKNPEYTQGLKAEKEKEKRRK